MDERVRNGFNTVGVFLFVVLICTYIEHVMVDYSPLSRILCGLGAGFFLSVFLNAWLYTSNKEEDKSEE